MKKYIYIWFLFFFNLNILEASTENYYNVPGVDPSACNQFIDSAESLSDTSLNEIIGGNSYNLKFEWDLKYSFFNKEEWQWQGAYKRSENQNLYLSYSTLDTEGEGIDVFVGDEVVEINGIKVASMTDSQVNEAINNTDENGNITYSLLSNQTKEILSYEIPAYVDYSIVLIRLNIKNIESIDSSKSIYKTGYNLIAEYEIGSAYSILDEIFKTSYLSAEGENNQTLSCKFSEDEFLNAGIFTPDIRPLNITTFDKNSETYYVLTAEYTDKEVTYAKITQVNNSLATFNSSFNFKTFPFDKQVLEFDFGHRDFAINYSLDVDPFYPYQEIFELLNFYEWNMTGYDYKIVADVLEATGEVSFEIEVERNYLYFITKILIPIFIIIGLTYSVMWISTKELESRLTVSVVCFLALITYTFIIDKDLPKLPYLTIMDYIILISYIFAAIPTIQSIYASRQRVYAKALIMDGRSRILLPALYFIIIVLIVILSISSNLENTQSFLQ